MKPYSEIPLYSNLGANFLQVLLKIEVWCLENWYFPIRKCAISKKATFFLTMSRHHAEYRGPVTFWRMWTRIPFKTFERFRAVPHWPGSHLSGVPEWIVDQDHHDGTWLFATCIHFSFILVSPHLHLRVRVHNSTFTMNAFRFVFWVSVSHSCTRSTYTAPVRRRLARLSYVW